MIAWKAQLKPSQIAQVASYVLSLQGTTPANPKASEGDLWIDENAEGDVETKAPVGTPVDSTQVE